MSVHPAAHSRFFLQSRLLRLHDGCTQHDCHPPSQTWETWCKLWISDTEENGMRETRRVNTTSRVHFTSLKKIGSVSIKQHRVSQREKMRRCVSWMRDRHRGSSFFFSLASIYKWLSVLCDVLQSLSITGWPKIKHFFRIKHKKTSETKLLLSWEPKQQTACWLAFTVHPEVGFLLQTQQRETDKPPVQEQKKKQNKCNAPKRTLCERRTFLFSIICSRTGGSVVGMMGFIFTEFSSRANLGCAISWSCHLASFWPHWRNTWGWMKSGGILLKNTALTSRPLEKKWK